jgi:cyclophilin family peptidyl-prolyl cis-trans isomerase
MAQLTPDKTYYGVNRAMPMTVGVPDGMDAEGARVALLAAGTAAVLDTADVAAGRIDLAALFPELWTREDRPVVYAQLMVGQEKVGPAVVLAPMINPDLAMGDPSGMVRWRDMGDTYAGIRAYVDQDVVLETTAGDIRIRMRPDQAPNTCKEIMGLVEGGFYEDIEFHRILADFVIQVGDPTGTGRGGAGDYFDLEASKLPHDFGVMSMARTGEPNSNGSQLFICLTRQRTQSLDGLYTAFGEAIEGAEAIRAIAATPVADVPPNDPRAGRPVGEPPRITRATLVDAAPYGTGPAPLSQAPATPQPR